MTNDNAQPSPILNNPYEEPLLHYDNNSSGDLSRGRVLPGRRGFAPEEALNLSAVREQRQMELYNGDELREALAPYGGGKRVDVGKLRETVGEWRRAGYPGVTNVTRRLLTY